MIPANLISGADAAHIDELSEAVLNSGPYEAFELLARPGGKYARLYDLQLLEARRPAPVFVEAGVDPAQD